MTVDMHIELTPKL